jgi:hypothetical protein
VVTLALAYTTAPRPRATLGQSLWSLRQAGWDDEVLVCADGEAPCLEDAHCQVVVNTERLGVLRNWVETLRRLVERTEAEHLLIVQDDVTWARKAAHVLLRDQSRYLSFWTRYVDPKVARVLRIQYHQAVGRGVYLSDLGYANNGALTFGLRRQFAQRLLAAPQLADYLTTHVQNVDRVIPAVALALGEPLQVWVPSLVNHQLGSANSSIKAKRPRDTAYWQAVAV